MPDATRPITIGHYATGNYHCKCCKCDCTFMGDRRAVTCLPCAVDGAKGLIDDLRDKVEEQEVIIEHRSKQAEFWYDKVALIADHYGNATAMHLEYSGMKDEIAKYLP